MRSEQQTGQTIQQTFEEYHRKNPVVYRVFKNYCFLCIKDGYSKYSSKAIIERTRWHFNFDIKGNYDFKINSNFTSRYSRMFAEEYPEHKAFFNYREIRSE